MFGGSFCLCQVETPIEEGAQRKLASICHARTPSQYQAQDTLEHKWPPVSLDLHNIFTGIGARGIHKGDQHLVNYFPCGWINNMSIGEQV